MVPIEFDPNPPIDDLTYRVPEVARRIARVVEQWPLWPCEFNGGPLSSAGIAVADDEIRDVLGAKTLLRYHPAPVTAAEMLNQHLRMGLKVRRHVSFLRRP